MDDCTDSKDHKELFLIAINWARKYIFEHGLPANTEDQWTRFKYNSFISNINRNPACLQRILEGKIEPEDIDPDPWHEAINRFQFELSIKERECETVALYECEKCHQTKNRIYKAQSRSLDEGDTELVTCVVCGHQWKNYN